ncbi:ATP-dependent DNA ligase [Tsukamurella sp. 8F]|uniref:ATP-dependent DNA ligase n=1 Tax=unclassified Tsukamurella TaxID=2633480 RepID=UPI0023B96C5C|nr:MULTISPECIES: ATP-dependent DNA ligase [unclassified Tsukamurella]MDF0528874.1 ATP-dependent DNA ligase [Tsukamurella sp. 8J]MDF0586709.1 ATP-dependent DNA ligase [Tsukamurella sp. 8F]
MLLASVVTASAEVGATRSRKAKISTLSAVVRAAERDEVPVVVSWLAGALPQGRIGTGWRTLAKHRTAAAQTPSLTVAEVDSALTALAGATGAGSTARRGALVTELLGRATQPEQQFLIGLLTGELRQGALAGVMTEAVAVATGVPVDAVRRAAMLSGSLPDTAAAATGGGTEALAGFGLEVGRGVSPMLASPAEDIVSAVEELGDVSVEFKLDGARIQVHRDGPDVRVFTRTLRDITAAVPEIVELARSLPCTSVVLDGETLALTDAGRPRPFQETMSRFGAHEGEAALRPFFFDCLHLDGVDLLDEPLSHRRAVLADVAAGQLIPSLTSPTVDEAAQHLHAALDAGHEGVMVKALDSPYAAGRRGRAWQKVKQSHTLDLVVLGAEWGYGRRTGLLSNLHLGARDPDGGDPIMVGKTFKGLTDALLAWQTEEFPRFERSRDAHAVYVRPEIVVEIELDGVQVSRRYPGGVALRFARVLRYRPDKTAAEADTIDVVRALVP